MNMTQNDYQISLYNDIMKLIEKSEVFYYNDWYLDGIWYRNANYRLASYTEFCEPGAMECRGIMFEISEQGQNAKFIRLASHPFQKFWNLNECPKTMDLDLSSVVEITDKADGSLIASYLHKGELRLKTKGSLTSDQAIASMELLKEDGNVAFREELFKMEQLGNTVIAEFCAMDNRIVLPYETPHLKVLGVRSRKDGSYIKFEDIDSFHFPEILSRWTTIIETNDPKMYIDSIPEIEHIEGVVAMLSSGQRFKIKTNWYLTRHRCKDSVFIPRRLYEAVLEEATDDMRTLFHDDPLSLKLISEMEAFVEVLYNHLVDVVDRYYERNKDLERKEYAILGQKELTKLQFGLAMQKYLGKDFSYKEVMKKRWKEFGLKDEKVIEDE